MWKEIKSFKSLSTERKFRFERSSVDNHDALKHKAEENAIISLHILSIFSKDTTCRVLHKSLKYTTD